MSSRTKLFRAASLFLPAVVIFLALSAAAAQTQKKNYLFNLTGTMRGYGDITGPLFTLIKFKKARPDANYIVVIDRRAEDIIKELFSASIDEVQEELGVRFFLIRDAQAIPKADISFELFFGGRFIHDFKHVVFNTDETAVVISDTMHGITLDEVRGPNFQFFFKPPGIGTERSGIITNPESEKFNIEFNRPTTAAHFFTQKELKDLFLKVGWRSRFLFGFVYGVHNEIFKQELIGQTKLYVQGIESAYPNQPVLLFTPHQKDELLAAGILPEKIFDIETVKDLKGVKNGAYFLSLPGLNNSQFVGLLALAEVPVLLEGNSSVSAAITLGKEFLMLRSAWNAPQIEDLLDVDVAAKTYLYSDVYRPTGLPLFAHYFSKNRARRNFSNFFLQAQVGDFSRKLLLIATLIEDLKKASSNADYQKVMKLAAGSRDEYLEYSLVQDLVKRRKVSPTELYTLRQKLAARGVKRATIETRLVPNQPNFSMKINELEAQGFLFEDIRESTSSLNPARAETPLLSPVCSSQTSPTSSVKFACANNLEKLKSKGDFSKVVWTFWDKGAEEMPAFNKYNVLQWRRILGDEWAVIVVSAKKDDPCYFAGKQFAVDTKDLPSNFARIGDSISSADRTSVPVVQSDIVRLALLKKYGGVWLDSSIVLLHTLDALPWTQMLFQKNKEIAGYINEGQNTMAHKGLDGFENWFIAAKKSSKVISAWLDAFNQYWETKVKGQDITEHPMFYNSVSLDHISPYYKNYLSQHAAMSYVLSHHPEFADLFVVKPASEAYRYSDIVGWEPKDIYEMFVNTANFAAFRQILVNDEDVDFLKFPSSNLKVVAEKLSDISMYDNCENLISYLYQNATK